MKEAKLQVSLSVQLPVLIPLQSDLRLAQIFPISEDDSELQGKASSASFADPFLLIIKDDGTVEILEADSSGDIDQVEQNGPFASCKWQMGCMYKSPNSDDGAIACLLDDTGTLKVRSLKTNRPIILIDQ